MERKVENGLGKLLEEAIREPSEDKINSVHGAMKLCAESKNYLLALFLREVRDDMKKRMNDMWVDKVLNDVLLGK